MNILPIDEWKPNKNYTHNKFPYDTTEWKMPILNYDSILHLCQYSIPLRFRYQYLVLHIWLVSNQTDNAENTNKESCHELELKKIDVDVDKDGKPDFNDPDEGHR